MDDIGIPPDLQQRLFYTANRTLNGSTAERAVPTDQQGRLSEQDLQTLAGMTRDLAETAETGLTTAFTNTIL
jgi:hypothetical protein